MAHRLMKKTREEIRFVKNLGAMLDFQTNFIAKMDKEREKLTVK